MKLTFSLITICWLVVASVARTAYADNAKIKGVLGFKINVTLSDFAAEELSARKETIVVAAYFSGIPQPDSKYAADARKGELSLGESRVEMQSAGMADFSSLLIETEKVKSLISQDFSVLVNVFSGRKTDKNNLLSCGIVAGTISIVQEKTHDILCKLIREPQGEV